MPAIRRLKTADNIRAALASIYRKVENGQMDLTTARVLIYCGATMAGIVRDAELEARLDAFEATQVDQ